MVLAEASLVMTRSGSAENKPDVMVYNTFGSIRAASISQTAPSCRRLSTLCFAGTITRLHATCILPMSRDLPWAVIASPVSRPGNHLFGGANGLPGGGPFRSLLLLCWSNSSQKKANVWVIGDLWNDISTKQPEFPLKSFEAALCLWFQRPRTNVMGGNPGHYTPRRQGILAARHFRRPYATNLW